MVGPAEPVSPVNAGYPSGSHCDSQASLLPPHTFHTQAMGSGQGVRTTVGEISILLF